MTSVSRRGRIPIKVPKKLRPDFSPEATWEALSRNIREIQKQNAANLSFEENHRLGYNMVLNKHGHTLYNGVCELIAEHLDNLAAEKEAEMLLNALRYVWDDHISGMQKLCQVLKYMDRVYTKAANVPLIWDAGLESFLKHIIRPPIKDHLITAILRLIYLEREGHPVNRSAVQGCVSVLLVLNVGSDGSSVYKVDLEPLVLQESNSYYEAEGKRLLETCNASEYLRRVEHRLQSEDERSHHYLSSHTAVPIRRILENHLLTAHLQAINDMPNSGLDVMIDTDNFEDLARLFRLFMTVPDGLPCLKKCLRQSIIQRGGEINRAATDPGGVDIIDVDGMDGVQGKGKGKLRLPTAAAQTLSMALKWVQDVLDLKDKFDQAWKKSFQSNRDLETAVNSAFESFINLNMKSPEFISLFIDENLKKGLKGKSDHEVEVVLDKTITVFRYITEKDSFERYYKNHLAKRLLSSRSVSDDAERGMLAKIKVECGYQFTQKLEGMFHDMKISGETMEAYRRHLAGTTAPAIEASVTVLSSTFWPIPQPGLTCTIPPELVKCCKSFEQFYFSRHSGRRLTWQPSLGNADVRVTFKARKHDLNVTTFALIILLLFEDLPEGEFLTYEEIQAATSIVDHELRRHLQSLACAKFKILKKHPPGRDVHPTDSFSFNHDFTSPVQKIKISTVSSKVESNDERQETQDRLEEERRHLTEACIMRIMKARRHMTHNDLVNEVMLQLASRFPLTSGAIKQRVEGLIDRDYLERCADRKSYNFIL